MYRDYYGFLKRPFSLHPDPEFYVACDMHRAALDGLLHGLQQQKPLLVLTGRVGSGKTTVIQKLSEQIGGDYKIGLLSNTTMLDSIGDLYIWISSELGFTYTSRDVGKGRQLLADFLKDRHDRDKKTLLIFDEAQGLPAEVATELCELAAQADSFSLSIILVGQRELQSQLDSIDDGNCKQRYQLAGDLDALNEAELKTYINTRIQTAGGNCDLFTDAAFQALYAESKGIPRVINQFCDAVFLYGFAENRPVINGAVVEAAIDDRKNNGASVGNFLSDHPTLIDDMLRELNPGSPSGDASDVHRGSGGPAFPGSHTAAGTEPSSPTGSDTVPAPEPATRPATTPGATPEPELIPEAAGADNPTSPDADAAPQVNTDAAFEWPILTELQKSQLPVNIEQQIQERKRKGRFLDLISLLLIIVLVTMLWFYRDKLSIKVTSPIQFGQMPPVTGPLPTSPAVCPRMACALLGKAGNTT